MARRRLIDFNWWMLPAFILVVWRAIASGEIWIYVPAILLGVLLAVWLNVRAAKKDDKG
jgi:hypothetical protein